MTVDQTFVSIGLPVYNGEKHIRQAIDSLLAQDYENIRLIISDNASTDATAEICQEYAARDKRVHYYRSTVNMGAAWNFNHVFELSSDEHFMWAAHDDYWKPEYISSCMKAFGQSGNVVLVGAMCDLIDSDTNELIYVDEGFSTVGLGPSERFIRYKSIIHAGRHIGSIFYGIYKRNILLEAMPMKKVIATDHLVLAKLCFQGDFVTIPKILFTKRWGGASASHKDNAQSLGINNQLMIKYPYLIREIWLQRIIFQTDRLSLAEKPVLAFRSLIDYLRFSTSLAIRLWYKGLPDWAKRPVKIARRLLYSNTQRT